MLQQLTQLLIRPKHSPYLNALQRFVTIYGVYLYLAIFFLATSTLIFTSPITCAVPKDGALTETFVNSRCGNKPLMEFEEIAIKAAHEKVRLEREKKQTRQKLEKFEPGNNSKTSKIALNSGTIVLRQL